MDLIEAFCVAQKNSVLEKEFNNGFETARHIIVDLIKRRSRLIEIENIEKISEVKVEENTD